MSDLNFTIRIAAGSRNLVDIDRFGIRENAVTFLFGESGIGKSLISRALFGLLAPEEYEIRINNESYERYVCGPWPAAFQENGFFVFQEPSTHLNPLLTIASQLHEGSLANAPDESPILRQLWSGVDDKTIRGLLEVFPKPYRPSGGEKQRMLLAMAFKKMDMMLAGPQPERPSLFVFDEPTGSLDNHFRDLFLAMLFSRFRRRPFTVLLISHDYSMISHVQGTYADLTGGISYKELVSHSGTLALENFLPETYLDWLAKQHPDPPVRGAASHADPLVSVESRVEVFGRTLTITRDKNGMKEAPMQIKRGSMVYLKAPSGTGKTTIVKLMMGLVSGSRFRMTLGNSALTERTPREVWRQQIWGKRMTMVFQHADEALNPRSTVEETFAGLPSREKQTREHVVHTLRELFDPEDVTDEFMMKEVRLLSGGQKQRLNLLRGLFLDTDVLIVDEPLNGLDFVSTTKVIAMLHQKQQEGKGILLISHNEEIFDRQVPEENVYCLRVGS
jgi:ABC-type glutathione transport system ATPase component